MKFFKCNEKFGNKCYNETNNKNQATAVAQFKEAIE